MTDFTYQVGINTGTQYYAAYEDHEWAVESGFQAPIQAWILPAPVVAAIMADLSGLTGAGREVTLTMGDSADPGFITIQRVVVIGDAPSDDPQKRWLLMSDVRWYFTRAWMALDCNVRRRTGEKRLVGGSLTTATPADTVAYAPWAINNGTAYKWTDFKDAVLTYLTTARHGRPSISFVTDTFSTLTVPALVLPESSTDGPAAVGIARAIESIPGASLRVALDGVIHVMEETPGAEETMVASLPPDLNGHGDLLKVDRSGIRPADVWRIYLDLELELRLTYNASGTGLYGTPDDHDPFLIPVIKIPDQEVTIPAGTYCQGTVVRGADYTVGVGSWIGQDEYYAAIGVPSGTSLPALTDDLIATHWFDGALDEYTLTSGDTTDTVWVARINAIRGHFRTYFRVNPKAWDRIRHFWVVRAAVWDEATGTRAASPVFCNYAYTPSDPKDLNDFGDIVQNVTDRYDNSTGLLSDCQPSPFELECVDEELGIFSINRNVILKAPVPGQGQADSFEVSDVVQVADIDAGAGQNERPAQSLRLATTGEDAWKFATVISVAPAGPNDLRRLYEVQVDVSTAASTAGLSDTPTGYGPDVEKRSQLAQARLPWIDGTGWGVVTVAALAFADDGGSPDTVIDVDESIAFAKCLFSGASILAFYNIGMGATSGFEPVNLTQEVAPLAMAIAAADLLTKLDCRVGRKAVPGDKNIVPLGSVKRVVHKVQDNRWVSILYGEEADQVQFRAIDFLPAEARTFILQTTVTRR